MMFTEAVDPFTQRTYVFVKIDDTVYLDQMLFMTRETSRHKFKVDNRQSYSRLNSRDYGVKEEPDAPIEFSAEAVKQFRERMKFKPWSDRR